MLTVYAIETSEIYGHGKRAVIWFSGCSLHCKGCINQYLWNKSSGKEYSIESLIKNIASCKDLKGVTYIGGEPLEQGQDLLILSKEIIKLGLDIVLFTGYELDEINELQKQIVDMSVVLITGRYDENLRNTNFLLRGSENQQLIVKNAALEKYYSTEQKQVEVEITEDGEKYLGFPEDFV